MKEIIDKIAVGFNAITPILVIGFLIATHGNYVNQREYEQVKNQIFIRLDNVETLIFKILNERKQQEHPSTANAPVDSK